MTPGDDGAPAGGWAGEAQPLVVRVPHSHLYPGLAGYFAATAGPGIDGIGDDRIACVLEFADGALASGCLYGRRDGLHRFTVDAYRTRAGTRVPTRRWRVRIDIDDAGRAGFVVVKRGEHG